MTQEDKELLLKDLCARLPYGVKVEVNNHDDIWKVLSINTNGLTIVSRNIGYPMETDWENCKPYLFPMSPMTHEQRKELIAYAGYERREEDVGYHSETYYYDLVGHENILYPTSDAIDWLNKNHFDYRGLIEKGLALDATGMGIY